MLGSWGNIRRSLPGEGWKEEKLSPRERQSRPWAGTGSLNETLRDTSSTGGGAAGASKKGGGKM